MIVYCATKWVSAARLFLLAFLCLTAVTVQVRAAEVSAKTGGLLIGIEPEHNIFDQIERYRNLAGYLSDQLGLKVRLTIMSRYGEVIKRFKSRQLDGAFLSSFTAALGIKEFKLEPVASPVNLAGKSTSRGYIFVRRDSGIKTVKDMRGKSFVFVDPATTEGYLFPMAFLRRHGVKDQNSFFSRCWFSGSHASAVFAVLDGRADIGAAKDTIFNKQITSDPSIKSELQIIAQSPPVPEVTLCLRDDIPATLRQRILSVLLNMKNTARGRQVLKKFEALRFIKASDSDFALISNMAQEAGITMSDYK
ncbi:MAG: phosphate/phosphite/phosphonate ABC transporter substrate-binding protein [Proteobacteria bacterium]|nr:phosphate/phosphite/phosphonate ABC transporter substrate-binding protein [Pseudomonadota bacterium]